ncbi:SDR family NAD(P)-dependent oxidoreductase [Williamwhitmania taraxaci]|uniref:Peroxisomal trans-2-enoyl-CoA reductase n=1 Tax=Williamwhitmania taraxaci TaxID=1640674 RepID=A0A1G6IV59_9BACT|nr:SDR family NAD(P)-dependent oxidoreductase [Williamwhitmania taraxaci]SDC10397.1 short chain dehydrogenase [Williamwhitmania taraxaci]
MDLGLQDQLFVVIGACSGLGRAVAENLLHEGARVIVIGRRAKLQKSIEESFHGNVETLVATITTLPLSPISSFITGQTISVDGGASKGIFG